MAALQWQLLTEHWVLHEMVMQSIKTSGLVWCNPADYCLICYLERSHKCISSILRVDESCCLCLNLTFTSRLWWGKYIVYCEANQSVCCCAGSVLENDNNGKHLCEKLLKNKFTVIAFLKVTFAEIGNKMWFVVIMGKLVWAKVPSWESSNLIIYYIFDLYLTFFSGWDSRWL